MGGVFAVLIIALVVLIFGRVFNYFKTPIWLSISIFVLLSFSGSYYIIRKALPFYFDTFGFEEWFLVFLLGSTFSGLAIYIYNDLAKDGIFGNEKKKVKITPSIPTIFLKGYPSNPLVDDPNLFAGGEFHCKYAYKKYRIVGCLESGWDGTRQLHIRDDEETLLVEAKYCHLIARSPNDLTDKEKEEMYIDGSEDIYFSLLNGIYPFMEEDFKEGVVLDIRNFQ